MSPRFAARSLVRYRCATPRSAVAAYVAYVHYVERLWRDAKSAAHGHAPEHAEQPEHAH